MLNFELIRVFYHYFELHKISVCRFLIVIIFLPVLVYLMALSIGLEPSYIKSWQGY